ncbi:unnamed protein product [Rhizophagus irregularis]|uniref:F-box domain-containing protein n=1 Tax=Rhizophagus irregularis TaxID=588596 RepID=A0A2I1HVG7_9GLOM|nr:hypothetical protein RhiirA4_490246 [Rhizophagus irregularis]CAB4420168.1 unnamed protein product [Rhizophagus irregularis]
MQRIPVEVAERIIANLSDKDLFIGSSIGDIYREIQAVREEERKGEIDWLDAEYDIETLIDWMDLFTLDQIRIMEDMLKNGMIVDSQEEEIIRHAI